MEPEVNILITCAGRRVELVKAFSRARKRLGIGGKTIACDIDATSPALVFADEGRTLPQISDATYIDAIKALIKEFSVSLVIPVIDTELALLASRKEEIFLETGARVLVSSPHVVEICSDKTLTAEFFKKNSIPAPETFPIDENTDLSLLPYPLFIKPRRGSSSINAFRVSSPRELEFFLGYVPDPIVQKLVEGREFTVDCLLSLKSEIISIVPRERIKVRAGEILKGRIAMHPVILEESKRLLSLLGAIGPVTLQGFLSPGGSFLFTEINPRFGGGVPMSIAAGADSCAAIYRMVLGKEQTPPAIRDGASFSRYDETVETFQRISSLGGAKDVNLDVATRDFKYYIFDWDDNILRMPTVIHLEKLMPDGTWAPHTVSTSLYSIVRQNFEGYRFPGNSRKEAFRDFSDGEGAASSSTFLKETEEAIERVVSGKEQPCPSFSTFKKTLVEGRLFAIVTARGHADSTIREGVKLFIDKVLSPAEKAEMMANLRGYRKCYDKAESFGSDEEELERYLSLNRYHAVTSPHFNDWLERRFNGKIDPENRKQFAIGDFVEHVVRIVQHSIREGGAMKAISVGFSDDDPGNIALVRGYIMNELSKRFSDVKFCVYDTSDPALEKGRKFTVSGQLGFEF